MKNFKGKLLNADFDKADDDTANKPGIYNTPGTEDEEKIYNFINMCVSYYYGDKKWFTKAKNNTIINNISYDKDENISVAEDIATFDKEIKLTK